MKRWWKLIETRIDALSLRERVFLFVSILIVLLLVAETAWLGPVQAKHRQLSQRLVAQETELQSLREELKNSGTGRGPGQVMREELAQVQTQLATVNQTIAQMPVSALGGTPLSDALAYFLRRHDGLTLVRTATLAVDPRQGQAGTETKVARQGLELTVAGPYPELVRYVQTLERALPAMRWGAMKLNSEQRPAELNIQVWLLGAAS